MSLTAERVLEAVRYDPDTGYFYWIKPKRCGIAEGDRAGWADKKYWRIKLFGKMYKASRLAWFVTHGCWPSDQIDHINGDCFDDRIVNLRLATSRQNAYNRSATNQNKLGEKNIHFNGRYFIVQVKAKKQLAFKHFKKIEDARIFRDKSVRRLHGDFARL